MLDPAIQGAPEKAQFQLKTTTTTTKKKKKKKKRKKERKKPRIALCVRIQLLEMAVCINASNEY